MCCRLRRQLADRKIFDFRALFGVALVLISMLPAGNTPADSPEKRAPGDIELREDDALGLVAEAAPGKLPKRYADWLDMVDLMITETEETYFSSLREDFRRDAFIEQFWKERDPEPLTHFNELRRPWEEHADIARARYATLLDGRAKVLLLKGEPYTFCLDRTKEREVWYYEVSDDEVFPITLFSNISRRPYEIWNPFKISHPALRSERIRDLDLRKMCGGVNPELMVKEITQRYKGSFNYDEALQKFLAPPELPSEEWVPTFAASTSEIPAGAETFDIGFEVAFPGFHQQRTVVEGIVVVPAGVASTLESSDAPLHRFALIGEVIRDNKLFDSFRYSFDHPSLGTSQAIPLVFQRYLRPGPARLMVRVEDLFGRKFGRVDRTFEVPTVDKAAGVPSLADSELMRLLAEANAAAARGERTLRLVAPARTVLTGLVRFKTFAAGEFDKVSFLLDGKPVLTKRRPPYSVELDLGDTPIPHLLRVSGFDENGSELARDELQLNPGGQRFRVRLAEPRSSETYRKSIPTLVDVQTPDDKPIDRVELFIDERRVATLHQEPFSQPLLLPEDNAMVYVRAVAYLEDGNSTEDVVFINAPDYLEEIDVQMVEVYATVHDGKGRPVLGLEESAFTVSEDGERQTLRRFEWVSDLSIHAGLLLDISASMEESLETVTTAARNFVEQTIQPKDRIALLSFNERPEVVQRFTNDVELVQTSLAALRSEGGTALYDSLVFALHYFHGVRGQKALLLLSDGQDESSGFAFEDTLEYARRAGVTVYAIGLGEAAEKRGHRKVLRKIAEETGGQAFFVQDVADLESIYATIQEELRAQYLLAYQSTSSRDPAAFRQVKVDVDGDLEVRTMSGYYP